MDYQWIIDTLGETWDDLDRYVAARPESDYDRPTACPGWAVRDLVGHLLGLTRVVLGEPVPAYPGPWPDYVHNPMGEVNESFVALYRRQPMSEVLVAYRDANRRALDALRDLDESGWERVGWTPVGDGPAHRFQEIRISDAWIHYQDARDALGEPADDPGVGGPPTLHRLEAALPFVVGKKLKPPDGTAIRLDLSGPHPRSVLVEVANGRADAVASSTTEPAVVVSTTTSLWWRRMAGRVSAREFLDSPSTSLEGDAALGARVADALHVMM